MANWRADLTFTDRFARVSELQVQQAIRLARPDKATTELNTWPQATEDHAYQTSKSKAEYDAAIVDQVQKQRHFLQHEPNLPSWDHLSAPHPSTEKVTFGSYKDAVPFKDGSSSTVYRAPSSSDPSISYALKVASPATQPAPHDSENEVRLLQTLRGHPNVINLIESFRLHTHLILVFPFLPWSLDLVLSHPDKLALPGPRKKSILKDLLSGLSYLHSQGIIHRDIKPSNLLLSHPLTGPAQIIDFGTAWSSFSSCSSEPANAKVLDVGTASYRAPELLFGNQSYGPSLDMWAAGCVAAEVLIVSSQSSLSSSSADRKDGGHDTNKRTTTLFESGDLGSELALIKSIFETLGTPDEETWPETKTDLPDWGKMKFKAYPPKSWKLILPGADDVERDFVAGLVRYESSSRMSADEALQHDYLAQD